MLQQEIGYSNRGASEITKYCQQQHCATSRRLIASNEVADQGQSVSTIRFNKLLSEEEIRRMIQFTFLKRR